MSLSLLLLSCSVLTILYCAPARSQMQVRPETDTSELSDTAVSERVVGQLTVGVPQNRTLANGQTDRFTVRSKADRIIKLSIRHADTDLFLEVLDPTGKRLIHVDSSDRAAGTKCAIVLANSAGDYFVTVTAARRRSEGSVGPGQYTLTLTDLGPPSKQDADDVHLLIGEGLRYLLRARVATHSELSSVLNKQPKLGKHWAFMTST